MTVLSTSGEPLTGAPLFEEKQKDMATPTVPVQAPTPLFVGQENVLLDHRHLEPFESLNYHLFLFWKWTEEGGSIELVI